MDLQKPENGKTDGSAGVRKEGNEGACRGTKDLAETGEKSRMIGWKILGNGGNGTKKGNNIYILVDIFFTNHL